MTRKRKASSTPKPTPSPSSSRALNASEEAIAAGENVDTTTGAGKPGVTGVPTGTKVTVGMRPTYGFGVKMPVVKATQYAKGAGFTEFVKLSNAEKIDLLRKIAQIPGLYAKGKAPTSEFLSQMASTLNVAPRPEDVTAIEKVMAYADSVGLDYTTAANNLFNNPKLAQNFFNIKGTTTGTVVVSDPASLSLELDSRFMDLFNTPADKKAAAAYAKEVNAAEKAAQGKLPADQREQILLKYVQKQAALVYGQGEDKFMTQEGLLGQTVRDLNAAYTQNGIPVTQQQIYQDSINSLRSAQAKQNVLDKINLQATALYPAIKDYILQGMSARDVLSPYISRYSQIYGVPAAQVPMSKISVVASGKELMSLKDWDTVLYKDPDYKLTQDYQNKTMNDVSSLLNFLRIG